MALLAGYLGSACRSNGHLSWPEVMVGGADLSIKSKEQHMGDKAKGRNNGKTAKKKAVKLGKHGLRPHEKRERDAQIPGKLS